MRKYDLGKDTPISVVLQRLDDARAEGRIYVIANLVKVLRYRGRTDITLSPSERAILLRALRRIRGGKKVLPKWLPIGYQTARFIWLVRILVNSNVRVTKRDVKRIKMAARFYKENDSWHHRRQLRSLLLTARGIGLDI